MMKEFLKKIKPVHKTYLTLLGYKRKLRDKLTIPGYDIKRNTIADLAHKYHCTTVFIETGTYMGDTVEFLKDKFEYLYSIELNEALAERASQRFMNDSKVNIVQGDSTEKLSELLKSIDSPVTFWLDGYYSSEYQAGNEYIITGKGKKLTPIMEELGIIKEHSNKKNVILIDDARLFNGTDDYPTKATVRQFVQEHLPGYHFSIKKDIIRILPGSNG